MNELLVGNAPCSWGTQEHQDQSGNRRKRPGGQSRDSGLVTERGKIVHAREAHHLPPRVPVIGMLGPRVRAFVLALPAREQPAQNLPF